MSHLPKQMADPALTDRILRKGRALVRVIEALGIIEPTGPFERAPARLHSTVEAAPALVSR
jgi:hypothetical protein